MKCCAGYKCSHFPLDEETLFKLKISPSQLRTNLLFQYGLIKNIYFQYATDKY